MSREPNGPNALDCALALAALLPLCWFLAQTIRP